MSAYVLHSLHVGLQKSLLFYACVQKKKKIKTNERPKKIINVVDIYCQI